MNFKSSSTPKTVKISARGPIEHRRRRSSEVTLTSDSGKLDCEDIHQKKVQDVKSMPIWYSAPKKHSPHHGANIPLLGLRVIQGMFQGMQSLEGANHV